MAKGRGNLGPAFLTFCIIHEDRLDKRASSKSDTHQESTPSVKPDIISFLHQILAFQIYMKYCTFHATYHQQKSYQKSQVSLYSYLRTFQHDLKLERSVTLNNESVHVVYVHVPTSDNNYLYHFSTVVTQT